MFSWPLIPTFYLTLRTTVSLETLETHPLPRKDQCKQTMQPMEGCRGPWPRGLGRNAENVEPTPPFTALRTDEARLRPQPDSGRSRSRSRFSWLPSHSPVHHKLHLCPQDRSRWLERSAPAPWAGHTQIHTPKYSKLFLPRKKGGSGEYSGSLRVTT